MSPQLKNGNGVAIDDEVVAPVPPSEGTRELARAAAYVAVLLVTLGGVYYATRGKNSATATISGHAHSGGAATTRLAQPIMLTPAEQQRIGVTYAAATVGSL